MLITKRAGQLLMLKSKLGCFPGINTSTITKYVTVLRATGIHQKVLLLTKCAGK
jgi:hypothetical protein